jgi:PAS domain S-box-containing protein
VLTAAKPAPAAPLRVLLVGEKEEDFFLIREVLERNRDLIPVDLDHARSIQEAQAMFPGKPYGLVLMEHATGGAEAAALIKEFSHSSDPLPFVVLTEDADEKTVAEIIASGSWNCMPKSQLDGATLVRTIHSTLALHSLQQKRQLAEETVRKLSRAVEQSADTVMITNRQGVIEYVNPAFEALTGYCHEEAIGKTPYILKSDMQPPETHRRMWETITGGSIYRDILINRKKNGELYYVEESISPVRDADGQITHFISNGRDVTDRVRLEEQLLQAQKMDAVGQLAGGVAHDFNNLLTIITSYSEMALDDVPRGGPLEAKIQEILLAAKRATELTRQLLGFSRKQPQALRVVDPNQILSGIAKTLPRLIGEDIEFSFLPGVGLGRVKVDPVQIEQILMNLAANARDAMPQGGRLRLETSHVHLDGDYIHKKSAVIPIGNYALISVSDDGAGIPPQALPHIFEPFFTTKPVGKGTGLGLATVYGIVKQNNGFIWVYSEEGSGTVFKIYLPCVKDHTLSVESPTPEIEPASRGSETLLLVEDEPAVRRAAAEFLRLQGYNVVEASDGVDALSLAEKHPNIDLLITDVVMPNMSGGELAQRLAKLRPDIKFLFVSGYTGQTLLDHNVVDLEANFLQKPFTLKQMSRSIRFALERSDPNVRAAGSVT